MDKPITVPHHPSRPFTDANGGAVAHKFAKGHTFYAQGDPADGVFYIQAGTAKVTVVSRQGKVAVVTLLAVGDFFGEGCLAGQPLRMASVVATSDCLVSRMEKSLVVRLLHEDPTFSEQFTTHLLARNIRVEEDLVDQLFNSSEKRLARLLLILANFGKEGKPEPIIAPISQETLASMIGTTRSRVGHFMNKFRDLGFISYNGHLQVHSALLSVVLHDDPKIRR